MLRLYQPCLPTRVYKAPVGAQWVSEIKLDGFRIVARKVGGRVVLQTKQGYDYASRYPLIVDALMRMRARSIVLDGEAMCGNSFDDLWNRANDEDVRLCAFDLLELDGEDFRPMPLRERKKRLAKLLRQDRAGLEYVEHLNGEAPSIFDHACKLGFEGIVCKRVDMPYRPGRSKSWVKLKNRAHPAIMRVKEAFELERGRGRGR